MEHRCLRRLALAAIAALSVGKTPPANAQTAPGAAPPEPPALCTDRPTKSYGDCTVPDGDFQIETDLFNWTRIDVAGTRTETYLYTNPTLKYGAGPTTDLEISLVPYEEVRTTTGSVTTTVGGVGDLFLHVKEHLTGASSPVQIALLPYVKAPTAPSGIGNGKWEGGLIVPITIALPHNLQLTFDPEIDVLANQTGGGRHAQLQGLISLAVPLTPALSVYGELWTSQNEDPAGTIRQYSADIATSYLLRPWLQLDTGANIGLNRSTPAVQLYAGVSTRF